MTQQVAWPVTVDMGLIRKRVDDIMSKLSAEFPETERYLNSDCYLHEVPSPPKSTPPHNPTFFIRAARN